MGDLETNDYIVQKVTNKLAAFQICIREVTGSNHGQGTGYLE